MFLPCLSAVAFCRQNGLVCPRYLMIRALSHLMVALLPSYHVQHAHAPTLFIRPCKHWLGGQAASG